MEWGPGEAVVVVTRQPGLNGAVATTSVLCRSSRSCEVKAWLIQPFLNVNPDGGWFTCVVAGDSPPTAKLRISRTMDRGHRRGFGRVFRFGIPKQAERRPADLTGMRPKRGEGDLLARCPDHLSIHAKRARAVWSQGRCSIGAASEHVGEQNADQG